MDTENTSLAMMDGLPYGEGGVGKRESHEEERNREKKKKRPQCG